MDETEEIKGELQGETGQTSTKPQGTSEKTEKTYTKADVDKAISDHAAKLGREKRAAETERDALKGERDELNTRLDELSDRIDAAEREKVRDNPDLVKLYQERREVEKRERDAKLRERDLERRELQVKADRDSFETDMRKWAISGIAIKYGLKSEELEELGISDMAKLEKIAQRLSTTNPQAAKKEEEAEFKPDSGMTSGGVGELTLETREKMSMERLAEHPSIKQRYPRRQG